MRKPTPTPSPSLPDGPLSRYLLDPGGTTKRVLRGIKGWFLGIVPELIIGAVVILAVVGIVLVLRHRRDQRVGQSARRIRVLPPPEIDPTGARNLWMGLHALLRPWWRRLISGQPHVAWEVSAELHDAEVAVWVPASVPPDQVEQAVEASWNGARVDRTATELPAPRGYTGTCELMLRNYDGYPLGEGAGGDPLRLMLGVLAGLAQNEHAMVQILARPASPMARRRLRLHAVRMRRRETKRTRQPNAKYPVFPNPSLESDVRAIVAKADEVLWHVGIRLMVTTPRKETTRGKIGALAGAFSVLNGPNGFERRRLRGGIHAILRRRFRRSCLLSAPELSMLATLPSPEALPYLDRARARTAPPPKELPTDGHVLGISDHPSLERPVAIAREDLCHHVHLIGETGTGKSTLMANLVLQDAREGRAAVVVDPKGDLVEAILQRMPYAAMERTCVLEPEDPERAVGLNMLAGENPDLIVDHILSVFKRIYESAWGARTDDIMRAACLTLTKVPGATLVEIPLLLTNREWRAVLRSQKALVGRSRDVGAFWDWYEGLGEQGRSTNTAPLMNKIRAFTMRGPVEAVVGQAHPKLDIAALIEEGGLLLVRIPKGTLGEETSRYIGSFVVARVWQACMSRARRPEEERAPVTLYVDEMHNYLALPRSFEDLLAEARGYRLALVLAHQHMGQLDRGMRDALAANARTKIAFTSSPDDATALEKHFRPYLTDYDLSSLGRYQAACRPSIGGAHAPAFTFRTQPLEPGDPERARMARDESGRRFAEPRERVEAAIAQRQGEIESRAHETIGRSADRSPPQPPAQPPPRPRPSQPPRDEAEGGKP
jgi:hypothetical protein